MQELKRIAVSTLFLLLLCSGRAEAKVYIDIDSPSFQ
jgi:hypothetical protein